MRKLLVYGMIIFCVTIIGKGNSFATNQEHMPHEHIQKDSSSTKHDEHIQKDSPSTKPEHIQKDSSISLPEFTYTSSRVFRSYKFASRNAEKLSLIPCYCNCGSKLNHKSLKDCYFNSHGDYNNYAAGSDVCINEALDVEKWSNKKYPLKTTRQNIEKKYKTMGNPTPTPPVQ